MRLLLLVLPLVIAQSVFAGTTNYRLPEIKAEDPHYAEYVSALKWAADNPDATLYQVFEFRAVTATSGVFSDGGDYKSNPLSMLVQFNGKLFHVPLVYSDCDNYSSFKRTKAGIYFIRRGFRWDPAIDGLARVTLTIRVSDYAGNILPQIEVEEESHQARN